MTDNDNFCKPVDKPQPLVRALHHFFSPLSNFPCFDRNEKKKQHGSLTKCVWGKEEAASWLAKSNVWVRLQVRSTVTSG